MRVTLYLNKQNSFLFIFDKRTRRIRKDVFFLLHRFSRGCVNLTRRDKLHRKVGEIRDGGGFCNVRILKRKTW